MTEQERIAARNKNICNLIDSAIKGPIEGCGDCGGEGEIHGHSGSFTDGTITGHYKPCPTCAPLRELRGRLCWHEFKTRPFLGGKQVIGCSCGDWVSGMGLLHTLKRHKNPDFTTPEGHFELIDIMQKAGLWERFVEWHYDQCWIITDVERLDGSVFYGEGLAIYTLAQILTDRHLFAEAVESYLETLGGEK
jgi:hypothetical protein